MRCLNYAATLFASCVGGSGSRREQCAIADGDSVELMLSQSNQRHQKHEPQRRGRAVDGRRPDAVLMLIQLEATDVLGRRSIGRASEEGCEAPVVTNVVLLGMGAGVDPGL